MRTLTGKFKPLLLLCRLFGHRWKATWHGRIHEAYGMRCAWCDASRVVGGLVLEPPPPPPPPLVRYDEEFYDVADNREPEPLLD